MLMVAHLLLDLQVQTILLFVLVVVFVKGLHIVLIILLGSGLYLQY